MKIVIIFILGISAIVSGNLLEIKSEKSEIALWIHDLIQNLNNKNSNINDVAVLKLVGNLESTKSVEKLFGDIISEIPKENIVLMPTLNEIWSDSKLRKTAVIIIISDVSHPVSLIFIV